MVHYNFTPRGNPTREAEFSKKASSIMIKKNSRLAGRAQDRQKQFAAFLSNNGSMRSKTDQQASPTAQQLFDTGMETGERYE